jgi:hypothetical protein
MTLPTHCIKCKTAFKRNAKAAISILVMGDEYIYSYYYCDECEHYTVEAYHDRFMGEDEISFLPPIGRTEGDYAVELIEACATPMNKNCDCASHKALYHGRPGERP